MKSIIGKLNDGGPVFTYLIVALIFVIIVLFVLALNKKEFDGSLKKLIAHVSWFALAWGYLGRTFGLIIAFDNIAAAGDISPAHLAGGLKMALVSTMCGLTAFILGRLFIIVLALLKKREQAV